MLIYIIFKETGGKKTNIKLGKEKKKENSKRKLKKMQGQKKTKKKKGHKEIDSNLYSS